MSQNVKITTPGDDALSDLCQRLTDLAPPVDSAVAWPDEQLRLCGEFGVYEWFTQRDWGGQQWDEVDIVRGYLRLSAACLTTTFVITQLMGGCQRIQVTDNIDLKQRFLPDLVSGRRFATLGISHLTTSRRHLGKPALRARQTGTGFVLDGFSPWVTGALHAQLVVTGATLDDGRHILIAVPTGQPGVSIPPPARLVALTASCTGEVHCDNVELDNSWLLTGPDENVMRLGAGARTGGLQTSTLALGLARASIEYLVSEAELRPDVGKAASAFDDEWTSVESDLLAAASGQPVCSNELLRTRANSLVLRATQSALAAAKGSGYVSGHPAGRWSCEALFFLVWSCPQPVMAAHLCELAGISG